MRDKKIELMAITNGIRFKHMTSYRAMLVHMRNDKISANEIAIKINEMSKDIKVNGSTVENWFTRGTQPKDEIIEILETWLQAKLFAKVIEMRNPELKK